MTTKDKLINWLAMQPGAVGLVRLVIDGRVPFDPNVPRRMFDCHQVSAYERREPNGVAH